MKKIFFLTSLILFNFSILLADNIEIINDIKGNGLKVINHSWVKIEYTGSFEYGKIFDTNVGFLPVASTTLIRGEKTILVDPGNYHIGFYSILKRALASKNLTYEDIDIVATTHTHSDHAASIVHFRDKPWIIGSKEFDDMVAIEGKEIVDAKKSMMGEIIENVKYNPVLGKYKVYIIDEVHMLSQAAFNAFLKTLEEPPAHAIFILATTEKHKIIPTILSRCQIFDFKRITVLDAKDYLRKIAEKEGITAEDDALHTIAQKADGAMRDALSIFDRVISFSGKNLTREAVTQNLNVLDYDSYFEMTDLLIQNKIPEVLKNFNSILAKGFEGHHFINGLAAHFRDLLVVKDKVTVDLLEAGDNAKKKYIEQSSKATVSFLIQSIDKANQCDLNFKMSKNKRLLVELTLMQIASITFDGQKKKPTNFIIPATFFTSVSPPIKEKKQIPEIGKESSFNIDKGLTKNPIEKPKPPVLKNVEKRSSSLSLKSIHKKKVEINHDIKVNYSNNPKDPFTEKELMITWKNYQKL